MRMTQKPLTREALIEMLAKKKPSNRGGLTRLATIAQVLVASNLLLPSTAYAYVDPGSGSMIVTTILGLIAAVGYTFRKYFYRLKRYITGGKRKDDQIKED